MKTWYHNITKGSYNIHDEIDLIDGYDEGDIILFTTDGCAILNKLGNESLTQLIIEWEEND